MKTIKAKKGKRDEKGRLLWRKGEKLIVMTEEEKEEMDSLIYGADV